MKIEIESDTATYNLSKVTFEPTASGLRGFVWASDQNGNPPLGEYTLKPFGKKIKLTGVDTGDNHLKFVSDWS